MFRKKTYFSSRDLSIWRRLSKSEVNYLIPFNFRLPQISLPLIFVHSIFVSLGRIIYISLALIFAPSQTETLRYIKFPNSLFISLPSNLRGLNSLPLGEERRNLKGIISYTSEWEVRCLSTLEDQVFILARKLFYHNYYVRNSKWIKYQYQIYENIS